MELYLVLTWLPAGYIGARLIVWVVNHCEDLKTGQTVKAINTDGDRLWFLAGIFGGYFTLLIAIAGLLPFLGMICSIPLFFLYVAFRLDRLLPWIGRTILSTARRLSPD